MTVYTYPHTPKHRNAQRASIERPHPVVHLPLPPARPPSAPSEDPSPRGVWVFDIFGHGEE